MTGEEKLKAIIAADPWMMEVLRCARSLNLPDWMIGAGFVRNKVWDHLHGFAEKTVGEDIDIDIIYFDSGRKDKVQEKLYEAQLGKIMAENWSVKNHARLSAKYLSCEDGMHYWPEVCTAVAVKLDGSDMLEVIAPYGTDDLMNLIVRRGYRFEDEAEYRNRVERKQWRERWPLLKVK